MPVSGDDSLSGTAASEFVNGGSGNDTVNGGIGSDTVHGGSGNDVLIYVVAENAGASDVYDGGSGFDVIELHLTAAHWASGDIRGGILGYLDFFSENTLPNLQVNNSNYSFVGFNLTVSKIETVRIFVDGQLIDPYDQPILLANDRFDMVAGQTGLLGNVLGNDTVGDGVQTIILDVAPTLGSAQLLGGGDFAYQVNTGNQDYRQLAEGEAFTDSFIYSVSDTDGDAANATVVISGFGVNDGPTLDVGQIQALEDAGPVTIDLSALGDDIDSDDDGTTLTYSILGQPALGSVSISGGTLQFDPGADFDSLNDGETQTVSFLVQATDSHGASVTSEFTAVVSGVTDPPPGDLDIFIGGVGNWTSKLYSNSGGSFVQSSLPDDSVFHARTDDLNGDGFLDLFLVSGSAIRVYLNNGAGGFVANGQVNLATGQNMASALGDLDGDGDVDAVVVRQSHVGELVLFNDGAGQFTVSSQLLGTTAVVTFDVALGDVDGDGDLDAWMANGLSVSDKLYLNNGSGIFTESAQVLDLFNSTDVDFADLDGDGDLDSFVTNGNYGSAEGNTVWLNDGSGNFSNSGQSLGNKTHTGTSLADLDGDGDIDAFVVTRDGVSSTWGNMVWLNDGTGQFSDSGQVIGAGHAEDVALGDMDNDGDLDAVVAYMGRPDRIYLNDGQGGFVDSGIALGGNMLSYSVVLGDFDLA